MELSASEKLLNSAARLFYERGITASGVDTIVADAGVSKPTLYANFQTKHRLILEVLDREHRQRRMSLEAHLGKRSKQSPLARLLSVFDWITTHQRGNWPRGCPFVNASVELVESDDLPAKEVIHRHKQWFRGVLTRLAAEAGAAAPAVTASQLHLLIEGANARMLAEGDETAISDARKAAEVLLAHVCKPRRTIGRRAPVDEAAGPASLK